MFKGKIIKFKEERNSSSKKTEKERELLKESKKKQNKRNPTTITKVLEICFSFSSIIHILFI